MSVHLVMLTCARGIMMNTAGCGDVGWHHREDWWSSRGRAGAAGMWAGTTGRAVGPHRAVLARRLREKKDSGLSSRQE